MRALVGVLFAIAVAVVGFGWGSDFTSVAVADVSALAAAAVGTVACWRASRRATGRHGWVPLTMAMGLWVVGEALWTMWEVVLGDEVPYPSIADVAYLGAVPFAVAGLLRFVPAGSSRLGVRSLLDGCVVATSTLFAGWALALGPAFRGGDVNLLSHAVTMSYPLTDVVLAALAIVVVQWGGTDARRAMRLVAAGFLLMAIADTAFTWMMAQGTYAGDALVTMLWPASYLVVAVAAGSEARQHAHARLVSVQSLLLPYIPLVTAVAIGGARVAGGNPLGPFLTVTGAVLVVGVLARQAVTAWDLRSTVAALHEREAELANMALTDALTGLANRPHFGDRLEQAVREQVVRPAVVYIDLDGFKDVNDRYGHAVGDRLLVAAAERLQAASTDEMLVARLGGDEFVVLVSAGHDEAVLFAQRIVDSFTAPFETEGEVISFQASVGVATAPTDGNAEEAVRRADAAMYVAKTTGKGRAVDYPDDEIVAA